MRASYDWGVIRALVPFLLLPSLALAQVSVNPGALDSLKPSPPAAAPAQSAHPASSHGSTTTPGHKPSAKPSNSTRTGTAGKPAAPGKPTAPGKPSASGKPAPHASGPVRLAPAPPADPVLAAPVVPPVKPAPPVAAPPPVEGAAGEAMPITGGLRITFGAGKADMSATTELAVQSFARSVVKDPSIDLNVYAYAAGTADDPSTPRRLSLSRALAIRAVLISEGIESVRIYPRALGATPSDGPPDRVDLTRVGAP